MTLLEKSIIKPVFKATKRLQKTEGLLSGHPCMTRNQIQQFVAVSFVLPLKKRNSEPRCSPRGLWGSFSHLGLPIDDLWWTAGELLLGTAMFRRINLNKQRTSQYYH